MVTWLFTDRLLRAARLCGCVAVWCCAVEWNPKVMVSVAPLSLMFLGMISFNNLCLKFVSVPFYNVARSLTIVTNVIFTYLLLGERTSVKVCLTLAVVILGFYIGIEGELDFSLIGTLFGVASSCFVSLNAIYTKKSMPLVDGDKCQQAHEHVHNVQACGSVLQRHSWDGAAYTCIVALDCVPCAGCVQGSSAGTTTSTRRSAFYRSSSWLASTES